MIILSTRFFCMLKTCRPKYQFLIKKREDVGIIHLINPKVFIEYWKYVGDVYNNIIDYNLHRKRNLLIVFDLFQLL